MSNYVLGQYEAALAFGFDKEAALDFLGPEVARYMRRALLGIPLATGAMMHALPAAPVASAATPASNIAYRGTPRHYADVQQMRGKALMDQVNAQQVPGVNALASTK